MNHSALVLTTITATTSVLMFLIAMVTGAFFSRSIGPKLGASGASFALITVLLANSGVVQGVFIVVTVLNAMVALASLGGER